MAKRPVIAIDFETYYDSKYSLKNMTTQEYLSDARFDIIGCAVSLDGQTAEWFSGTLSKLQLLLQKYRWAESTVVAHNAQFDGAILEWVLGIKPAGYFCTAHAARGTIAHQTGSVSLGTVAAHLGVGIKGEAVAAMSGITRAAMTAAQEIAYGEYCKQDTMLAFRAYQKLETFLPEDEIDLIDLTVRKFVRPKLLLDTAAIDAEIAQITADRAALIESLPEDVGTSDIMSNDKFIAALERRGVRLPTRVSSAGKVGVGLSKKDLPFMSLLRHSNPEVVTLAKARLVLKSTIRLTRAAKFKRLAATRRKLAIPLLYYGAHTGRLSGTDSMNMQNLPRGGALRKAMVAPPGYSVVTVDLSAIEARITGTLAGCKKIIQQFEASDRSGSFGPYEAFATEVYDLPPVDTVSEFKKLYEVERFVGKTCILGLGYGMGHAKLHLELALKNIALTEQRVKYIVNRYREIYKEIPFLWERMNDMVNFMAQAKGVQIREWGPVKFMQNRILLPNGMYIHYPQLGLDPASLRTAYRSRTGAFVSTWGGSIVENISQALARIIISTIELTIWRVAKLEAVMQVHDELVYVVPDKHVEKVKQLIKIVASRRVDWMPELPIACEVKSAKSYGDAK